MRENVRTELREQKNEFSSAFATDCRYCKGWCMCLWLGPKFEVPQVASAQRFSFSALV